MGFVYAPIVGHPAQTDGGEGTYVIFVEVGG